MTASVVTFSIQLGSGGYVVAEAAAQMLGYRYIDRDVLALAASRAGVTQELVASAEQWPRLIERLMNNLAAVSVPEDEDIPAPAILLDGMTMRQSSDYRNLIEQVVHDLSSQGSCAIVGHAAQVILKGQDNVLKVLLVGSPERRAERIRRDQGVSSDEARKTVRDSDRERRRFFKNAYGVDWLEPSLYDLVLNTDALDDPTAAAIVLKAARDIP